ncbi:MAG: hypothetical protein K5883_04135 [Pseudobutyrivibrio sp.]|nr:hypothetical protein [Pseudobutyrivibrio sp.]
MQYPMNKVFDKVDVICEMKSDGTVIPIKFRLMNEDGDYEFYKVNSYRAVPKQGAYTTKDNLFVCNSTEIFECKVAIFGLIRTVRLYYEPKSGNTWKLAV